MKYQACKKYGFSKEEKWRFFMENEESTGKLPVFEATTRKFPLISLYYFVTGWVAFSGQPMKVHFNLYEILLQIAVTLFPQCASHVFLSHFLWYFHAPVFHMACAIYTFCVSLLFIECPDVEEKTIIMKLGDDEIIDEFNVEIWIDT